MKTLADLQKKFDERAKASDIKGSEDIQDSSKYVKAPERNHLLSSKSTKSNMLTRAYYRFSLNEKRVMESMISQLDSKAPYKPPESTGDVLMISMELNAEVFATTFGLNVKNAYTQMKTATNSLMRKIITVREGPEDYTEYTLMAKAKYQDGQGLITATVNPLILPHLLGLRRDFTSYSMLTAVNFSSSYTWRFYELLESWAKPKKQTDGIFAGWIKKMPIDELRSLLGVPESYRWDTLETRVLKCAQAELSTDANIEMAYTVHKTGRKYTHIDIEFIENDQMSLELDI